MSGLDPGHGGALVTLGLGLIDSGDSGVTVIGLLGGPTELSLFGS
jgi:hypothetical protein